MRQNNRTPIHCRWSRPLRRPYSCRLLLWAGVAMLLGPASVCLSQTVATAAATQTEWDRALSADNAAQFQDLSSQLASRRAWFAKVADEAFRREAILLPEDRDPLDVVLRRTRALLDDLQKTAAASETCRAGTGACGVGSEGGGNSRRRSASETRAVR